MYKGTQEFYFQGMFKWVRATSLDKFGKWAFTLYPTPESLEQIRDLQARGLKNVVKKDDDGYYVNFSCQPTKLIKGKVVAFEQPKVFDGTAEVPAGTLPPPLEVPVGNGSTGTAKIEVYEHPVPGTDKKSVAARWKSILVKNLIPYNPPTDLGEDQKVAANGLTDQKEEIF